MRNAKPVSVLFVGMVSAGLQGGLAVLFVPALSFLFLVMPGTSGRPADTTAESWMTAAVVAPLCFALVGFALGSLMAATFNLFVKQKVERRVVVEELPAFEASIRDAA